jgi:hypothetical protein
LLFPAREEKRLPYKGAILEGGGEIGVEATGDDHAAGDVDEVVPVNARS